MRPFRQDSYKIAAPLMASYISSRKKPYWFKSTAIEIASYPNFVQV